MKVRLGAVVTFVESDLFRLAGDQRGAALDALTRGDALPFVILGDQVICAGSLDAETIESAVQGHLGSQ